MLYLALQCCDCATFQVKPETKSKKWRCSVCSRTQSRRKVFGTAQKAALVRGQVQELNRKRLEGALDDEEDAQDSYSEGDDDEDREGDHPQPKRPRFSEPDEEPQYASKWDEFL